MTVPVATARVAYSGSGSTGPFSITFYFLADSHIKAVKLASSVETTLVLTTDYTLTGAGDEDGGALTLVVALAVGETLTITRNVPITQETNWPVADPFPAASHEEAADKLTMIVQQINDQVGRTLRQPTSDATVIDELPVASARADKFLTFDSDGQPVAITGPADTAASLTVALAASSGSSLVGFVQSGTATPETTQTALRRWCWIDQYYLAADGSDYYPAAVRAIAAGHKVIWLGPTNYSLLTRLPYAEGVKYRGMGKSVTSITLGADIIPFDVLDINDTGANDILVVAYATQSNPILRLTANTVSVTRNNFDDIQVSAATLNFNPIHLRATGAFGVHRNDMRRWSLSGVGTVAKFETTAVNGWVNSNTLDEFLVNDFIIGADFANSAGAGGSNNVCRDWSLQASSRTTHGFRIPDSSAGENHHNLFDAFTVYDLQVGGIYCDIGTGVVGTEVRPPEGPDFANSYLFVDNGELTRFTGAKRFGSDLLNQGHWLPIPTCAGWTAAVTGSGASAVQAAYNQVQTGTTLNSTAIRYTETIGGFGATALFGIDYSQPLSFRFAVSRATDEANAVGRVQLKTVQTEGALAGKGIGVRVSNYALYGESYGSAGAFVDLSVTMADTNVYEIEIKHYPGQRIEWWVNGVFKAQQTTVANIPGGVATAYLVHSIVTTISNPSADAQMFLLHPALWVDM